MTKDIGPSGVARVEAYLAALPADQRAALEQLRATIRRLAPGATEGIGYDMPSFFNGTKYLVAYAAFKDHMSFFPASGSVRDRVGTELKRHFSGKATLHFTPENPLSDELVAEIVRIRLADTGKRSG